METLLNAQIASTTATTVYIEGVGALKQPTAAQAAQPPDGGVRTRDLLASATAMTGLTPLVITSLQQTCSACPAQWQGELADGRAIYIRYRYGRLRATAGNTYDDAIHYGSAELLAAIASEIELNSEVALNDLGTWQREHALATRAAIPGGQMLFHETVNSDEFDGAMDTEEMLSYLQGVCLYRPPN